MPKITTPETFDEHLGRIVSRHMSGKGWSQTVLSKKADIPISTIGRRLRGEIPFTVAEVLRIAKLVGEDPADIFNEALRKSGGIEKLMSAVPDNNVTTGRFDKRRDYEAEHEAGGKMAALGSDQESTGDEPTD